MAIVAPILVFIYPPSSGNKKTGLNVTLDKPLSDLAEGDALKFTAPAEAGFVMLDGGGDNYPGAIAFAGWAVKEAGAAITVFAINCSHLGCSINFNSSARRFECPCHGSMFDVKGNVIHGPAAYPLSHLEWKQGSSPAEITVSGYQLKGIG